MTRPLILITALLLPPLTALAADESRHPQGDFTIINLPWVNHGPAVLHRDTPERRQVRDWLQKVLRETPAR